MERIVERVKFIPKPPRTAKIAVYTRVSSDKDESLHSLIAQAEYYKKLVDSHNDWELVDIYADNARTGTKSNRPNFQRLLSDCRAGLVDMVITKSVSRFARNTVTLLSTVRELKALHIDVFFEEEGIHSMSSEGEIMLTLLASIAQDQSLSNSENTKWRIKKNFEQGIPWDGCILGYRHNKDHYVIKPEEAKLVRYIFQQYLDGIGIQRIVKNLNAKGYKTRLGCEWHKSSVRRLLSNYTYTGNLLLQKTYSESHLTKKKLDNHGEQSMYHVENTHEAIISLDDFNKVQARLASQAAKHQYSGSNNKYPLTGRITCACCGKNFKRRTTATGITWICKTYFDKGKEACPSKQIPEPIINALIEEVGGLDLVDSITAYNGNLLVFCMINGDEIEKHWMDRSRSESWTAEKRTKQSKIMKEKHECNQIEK